MRVVTAFRMDANLLLLALFAAVNSLAAWSPLDVVETFQGHVNHQDHDAAAALVADDAVISTPLGRKTKHEFLNILINSRNAPVWHETVVLLDDDDDDDDNRTVVSYGTRKLWLVTIPLQRIIEIDPNTKQIQKITVGRRR